MPNKNKIKGNTFERKIVKDCEKNDIPAERAYASNGRYFGMAEEVDVLIDEKIRVQAKCRRKLPSYLLPSNEVDLQVVKQDRGETLVIMRFDDWLTDYRAKMESDGRL